MEAARKKLYNEECVAAGKELMFTGVKLRTPHGKILTIVQGTEITRRFIFLFFHSQERVKLCQWLRKISSLRVDHFETLKMKHEYLMYLKATLQGEYKVLTKPFNEHPPENLVPLAEMLSNKTADSIPGVPRAGKLWCFAKTADELFMNLFSN